MKVYALVYAFPYEGAVTDSLYLRKQDAEKARIAMRPQKFWEVDEMDVEMPKKWADQFDKLTKQVTEEEPWTEMTSKKKRSSKPSS